MIEKLKLEPYIPESLVVRLYSKDGHLVAERYDTIYWVRDEYFNVACDKIDCFVDAKLFCTYAPTIKKVNLKGDEKNITITLFNGAKYDLEMVVGENIPTFEFSNLPYKSVFAFGGVESAASKSPLQRELNTVYVDERGCVASDSIVAGESKKFTSEIPFAVPEGIHTMLNGAEAEWGIQDNKLFIAFGAYKIVAELSALPNYAWWESCREALDVQLEFTPIVGFKSSLVRLSNFGNTVYIKDGRIAINKDHWEPFVVEGSGELFDITNLSAIATDDSVGVALFNGNLYLKTADAIFVCCAVDMDCPEVHEEFDSEIEEPVDAPVKPKNAKSLKEPKSKTTKPKSTRTKKSK